MLYQLLNINNEPTPSMLLGLFKDRDGAAMTVIYELEEGRFDKISGSLDELLSILSKTHVQHSPNTVLVYQRFRFSGMWSQVRPTLVRQDTQSLDFMGVDTDALRSVARDTSMLDTVAVTLSAVHKADNKAALFAELTDLWEASSGPSDFKQRVSAWTQHQEQTSV